jgi:DNA polymerase I-like protein with 3'-5' exonuclease and polymerase domains
MTHGRNGTCPPAPRDAAELYLELGLAPIRVPHKSKNPGYGGWQDVRATAADLDRLFPRGRASNLGILNGAPSANHHDADLDCPEAIAAAGPLLPPTGWVFGRTSARRAHHIFHTDRPLGRAQLTFTDLDEKMLAELRGTGGMTVYPPSTHEGTGEPITWDVFTEPAEVRLDDLQRDVARVAAAALIARHWPAKGGRDRAAMALSGGLTRAAWAAEDVSRFIEAVATAACDDELRMRAGKPDGTARRLEDGKHVYGWPMLAELLGPRGTEVVQRVRQWLGLRSAAAGTGVRRAINILPYRPFPVAALPTPLRDYVEHGSRALRCDPTFIALPAMAVCAGLIGDSRAVRLRPTWVEPCVIWAILVSGSGTMKSPGYKLVVNPVWDLQHRQRLEDLEALEKYKRELKQADGDDSGLAKPVRRYVIVSDTTIERLAQILEDNPRGVLVAREELSAWLGSFARYKAQKGSSDVPNWLELHGAGTISYERKTGDRPSVFIRRALASVTGTIQPEVFRGALANRDLMNSGLIARMLPAMPDRRKKVWTEEEVDPDVEQAYLGLIGDLHRLEGDTRDGGGRMPHVLRLSPEAREAFITFYKEWAEEQAGAEGEMASALAKLEAYAARLALVHHVVTHVHLGTDDLGPIGRGSVEAGVALCRWFAYEARRIYAVLAESDEQTAVRRLVEFIRARGGEVTARDVQRSNQRKYPSADDAEAALEGLAQGGLGAWESRPSTERGGTPYQAFKLSCVTCDTTDTTLTDSLDDEDGPPPPVCDRTGDRTPPAPQNPNVWEGSVGCVTRHTQPSREQLDPGEGKHAEGGCVTQSEGGCVTQPEEPAAGTPEAPSTYLLVRDQEGLQAVAAALDNSAVAGLDVETTGLDSRTDEVRLLSLSLENLDGDRFSYLIDCSAVDPRPLWGRLAEKGLVAHNAAFDLAFLAEMGFTPAGPVHDTLLLARLLVAGTYEKCDLAAVVQREVGQTLDKAEQRSNWSGPLTDGQLRYAARDVEVLVPLHQALTAKVRQAKLEEVARIETRALPAFTWLGRSGIAFDSGAWGALAAEAEAALREATEGLDRAAPPRPDRLEGQDGWDWDSTLQVKRAFAAVGVELDSTEDEVLSGVDHPMAALLREHRAARRRVSNYGADWNKAVADDGRIYAGWIQLGSRAGRTSCRTPNLQQVPRDGRYRRCFVAPPGRVLVKADYSQLQLRIAAKIADEKAMLDAYARGEDLHTRTARQITGKAEVTKADRQVAKALNFGLLFGMGAQRLQESAKSEYGVDMTLEEARDYRRAFFEAYPGLARWHRRQGNSKAAECRTLAGRRRLLDDKTPHYTDRLNSPVQGTEADGAKLAMALLWERRDQCPGAVPVIFNHDEIVVECDEGQKEAAAGWLRRAMLDGMAPLTAPVPVEVEVTIAASWGGEKA